MSPYRTLSQLHVDRTGIPAYALRLASLLKKASYADICFVLFLFFNPTLCLKIVVGARKVSHSESSSLRLAEACIDFPSQAFSGSLATVTDYSVVPPGSLIKSTSHMGPITRWLFIHFSFTSKGDGKATATLSFVTSEASGETIQAAPGQPARRRGCGFKATECPEINRARDTAVLTLQYSVGYTALLAE